MCLEILEKLRQVNVRLTRRPGCLKLSGLVPVLQYASGFSSDLLAKVLWTLHCISVIQNNIFHTFFVLLNACNFGSVHFVHGSSDGIVSTYFVGNWGSVPSQVMFLITTSVIAFERP